MRAFVSCFQTAEQESAPSKRLLLLLFLPNVFSAYYNRALSFTWIIALHKFFVNFNLWSVFTKSVTTMQSQKLKPGLKVEATVELTPSSNYLEVGWSSGHAVTTASFESVPCHCDDFVVLCSSPPQNVKFGTFTSLSCRDGNEMYKKTCCTCKVVVLLV